MAASPKRPGGQHVPAPEGDRSDDGYVRETFIQPREQARLKMIRRQLSLSE